MFPDHIFELKYFEVAWASAVMRAGLRMEEFHHQYEYDGPRGG